MTIKVDSELDIVTTENKERNRILIEKAHPVTFPLTKEDAELIEQIQRKLYQINGVGLAAPQVNRSRQIIAVHISEIAAAIRNHAKAYPMHVLLNPDYIGIEQEGFGEDFEACFSICNKSGKVPRYNKIILTYYNLDGSKCSSIEEGFYARVLQHEIDHINGILITDRLTSDCVQGDIQEMMKIRRNELSDAQKKFFDVLIKNKDSN
jgi:peptide deformylase